MHAQRGEPEAARPGTLPRWAAVGGVLLGLLLFTMVVLLALTLAQLHDSGGHIESQDKKIAALFDLGRPLAGRADSLSGDVGPALDDARRLVAPLVRQGSGADLASVLERLPLLQSSVQRLTGEAVPLLEQVDPSLLTGSLASLGTLAANLEQDSRLVRLIDGASAALVDVSARDLVGRAARSAARLRKVLAVQRDTRALQSRALRVQLRSLEIQRRSLKHVRSLDRKTGGELAPVP